MNVSVGKRWEDFVSGLVNAGRYGSSSEVIREGLRLVEERETKLAALRRTLDAAIERGGSVTDEEVAATVEAALAEETIA
jgi:antitoxin ParD1/3/4